MPCPEPEARSPPGLPGVSRTLCRRRLRFRSKLQNEASPLIAPWRAAKAPLEPVFELPAFDLEARSSSIEVIGLRESVTSPASPVCFVPSLRQHRPPDAVDLQTH